MSDRAALAGLRVLDLASLYAGPLIATMLGDFGADVVKVEHPRGDDARRWGQSKDGIPLWWKVISRNKKLVTLDLNDPGDRNAVRRMCRWADVVIENFRPGRLERWGLGYDTLTRDNPGLVLVRVTGFGQTGPNASQPGFGTLAEAYSGFAAITGASDGPPTLPAFGLADGVAGLAGAFAVLAALRSRDVTSHGQVIDLSLYEPLFSVLGPQVIEYDQLGIVQERHGNRSPRTAPRNAYETADGRWVALSAGTQQIANRIFAAIGRPELADDPRFSSAQARREHVDEVDALVAGWIRRHRLEEVLGRFRSVQAPIAPVLEADQIVEDPHYRERGSVITCSDPELGEILMQAPMPRLSRTPGQVRWTGSSKVGADEEEVFRKVLGMSRDEARKP